jgi:hypothetical protein
MASQRGSSGAKMMTEIVMINTASVARPRAVAPQ